VHRKQFSVKGKEAKLVAGILDISFRDMENNMLQTLLPLIYAFIDGQE
jgi:hypothetical protein